MTKELQEKKSRGGFHRVTVGETLSAIGRHYNIPVDQLKRINGIENAHVIHVGQLLALKAEAVCQVQAHFLDAQGRPIAGLRYRIHANGKQHEDITPAHGCSRTIVTESPKDKVDIFIKTLKGTWKQLYSTVSGFGNKIINCVSNEIHIPCKTLKDTHADQKHSLHIDAQGKVTFKQGVAATKGNKKTSGKGKKGHVTSVSSDGLPDELLGWFKEYTGEKITEEDYKHAAAELGVEVAILKAVAAVESSGNGFDDRSRPKILFERHWFSSVTDRKFDQSHPDLSNPKTYCQKSPNKDENYGTYKIQYGKLIRACSLEKEAAYQACSWGAFQIMGISYKECGFKTPEMFVKEMCISEKKQLGIFIKFCKSKNGLISAMKSKEWDKIAFLYNGPSYKKGDYHNKIKKAYEKFT